MRSTKLGWGARLGLAIAIAGSSAALGLAGPAAARTTTGTTTSVRAVEEVTRAPVGKMLATPKGRSLYILPAGTCTGSCLQSWPPLLIPAGSIPTGAKCLGTATFGTHLQVTFQKKKLYLFIGDSGSSLTGNGVMGFKAATVTTSCF